MFLISPEVQVSFEFWFYRVGTYLVNNVLDDPALNHRPEVESGLLAEECGDLLRDFFANRR